MSVGYDRVISGWPSRVESRLARKVGAFSRHGGWHLKVGITNSPETRWRSHAVDGWRRMEVVYRSTSWMQVQDVECRLVERFHMGRCLSPGRHHNVRAGGGGARGEARDGYYYVYILIADQAAQLYAS